MTSDSTNLVSSRFELHARLIETQDVAIPIPFLVVSGPDEL